MDKTLRLSIEETQTLSIEETQTLSIDKTLRLSDTERLILDMLRLSPEGLSPSQMVEKDMAVPKKAKDDPKLNRNTIYVIVGRMETKGLLKAEDEEKAPGQEGRPRRLFSITAKGRYAWTLHNLGQVQSNYEEVLSSLESSGLPVFGL